VTPWIIFLASAVAIIAAGTKLSQYGDQIAEYSGLGRLWIGVVLLAGATSLPEILTDINAAFIGAPDLAVGDLLGSNMANMCILGIIDMLHRQHRVWQQVAYEHVLSAALATALTGLAGLFILIRPDLSVWQVGFDTLLIGLIYVLGMRVVYRQEDLRRRQEAREKIVEATVEETPATTRERKQMLRNTIFRFVATTGVIVVAAPFLASSANDIAQSTGIGATFVGSSLVAITTSLPELVTAVAAVRLGAFDLAVGNLFGSNAFNMCILLFTDIAYRSAPLLSVASSTHVFTAFLSILLMNIGIMGIIYRAEKRFFLIEPDSALMILGYVLGMWTVYRLGP
jgi:cation:H+ antiporter